jgi:polysaccharide pyruvyl transferase CsaB
MKIVLVGYYGSGNIGDGAILEAIAQRWKKILGEFTLTVVAYNPNGVHVEDLGMKDAQVIPNSNRGLISTVAASSIRNADLVVVGGGGLFHDFWLRPSLDYGWPVWLAKSLGVKTMGYGLGVGPLKSVLPRTVCGLSFKMFDAITVRDEESLQLTRRLCGRKSRIELASDPVMLIEMPGVKNQRHDEGNATRHIGVFPRKVHGRSLANGVSEEDVLNGWITLIDGLARKADITIVSMDPDDDEYCRIIGAGQGTVCDARHARSADGVIGIMQNLDLCVGMRLHSLILALRCNVPYVSISSVQKIDSFSNSTGMGRYSVSIENLANANKTIDIMLEALMNPAELKARLVSAELKERERARVSESVLLELLGLDGS